jgi:cytochrome P450
MPTPAGSPAQSSPYPLASDVRRARLRDGAELLRALVHHRGNAAAALGTVLLRRSERTLTARLGRFSATLTCRPQLARSILSDDHDAFSKMPYERHVLDPVMAGGSILLEGDAWQTRRQAIAPAFSPSCIDLLASRAADAAARRVARWSGRVNVSHEMRCLVNEVLGEFFAGSASAGIGTDPDSDARVFQSTERSLESRVTDPWDVRRRVGRASGRDPFREFERIRRRMRETMERLAGCPAQANESSRLFMARLTTADAAAELSTMLAAGATSGHQLSWTCDLLARSPDAQELARQDALGGSAPEREERVVRGELEAALWESLRLYPPASMIFRRHLDSGEYFVFNLWAMHRDPDAWTDADSFRPARWLDMRRTPDSYMPYGLGPRICIGRRWSQVLAREALAAILRVHTLTPVTAAPPPARTHIMTRPVHDIVIEVTSRSCAS